MLIIPIKHVRDALDVFFLVSQLTNYIYHLTIHAFYGITFQYLSQAKDEEIVYSQLYGNLSPYWKKLNFTPKPYWWKQHSGRKKEIQKET